MFPENQFLSKNKMKITKEELIHAHDRQLRALGIERTGNKGWLYVALRRDFTPEEIKLFVATKSKPKATNGDSQGDLFSASESVRVFGH